METYIFDFDGTLVDSMPTFISLMLRILDENGVAYGDDIVTVITPLGYRGTAEYFKGLGVEEPLDALVHRMHVYAERAYVESIPAKETVPETLRALRARGASLNILTASPHEMLDPCLRRLGIYELFDNVWSCEDFGTTKSDPEIYRRAAERLGRSVSEIVFVDDNIGAVSTAKQAGMRAYGIYDDSSRELVSEMKAATDRYLYRLAELTEG